MKTASFIGSTLLLATACDAELDPIVGGWSPTGDRSHPLQVTTRGDLHVTFSSDQTVEAMVFVDHFPGEARLEGTWEKPTTDEFHRFTLRCTEVTLEGLTCDVFPNDPNYRCTMKDDLLACDLENCDLCATLLFARRR